MADIKKQLEQIKRGSVDLISEEDLLKKLKEGRPLRIKVGFDPTRADLHLGHTVLMQKMRQFQDLGHTVIFLIGDYTALIGDPSGRDETRPTMLDEEIDENAKTYVEQASKILDMDKAEIRYNSEWLGQMSGVDFLTLSSKYSVARMLERDDFKKRYKEGHSIRIHEFIYPLLQGQDSVALEADVELGGTDQIFNLLVGRDLQKERGQEAQVVLTMPLLVGTDGVQKMSKSYDNYIGITDAPGEIFGKVMSISDALMWDYYQLLSSKSLEEIAAMKKEVSTEKIHPKDAKVALAKEIVARFHTETDAENAAFEFDKVFAQKGKPTDIPESIMKAVGEKSIIDIMVSEEMAASKSEARRLIQQGGVSLNDQKVSDINDTFSGSGEYLLKVGKRKFRKIILK